MFREERAAGSADANRKQNRLWQGLAHAFPDQATIREVFETMRHRGLVEVEDAEKCTGRRIDRYVVHLDVTKRDHGVVGQRRKPIPQPRKLARPKSTRKNNTNARKNVSCGPKQIATHACPFRKAQHEIDFVLRMPALRPGKFTNSPIG